ncbi:hypothetical protein [Bacillus wiedmannii]|uniref:hypothetical protein n=2 Tax=Bacillus wiedmannii TaxID=1890302 RepID=UPI000BF203FF|nr:hypothetical protein [Bacillus wiedmannii]PEN64603.1 hypothetical protein CN576_11285 [Bacillus wiedmannii]PGA35579.1 hypothetical protein COL74_06460 [Bacillus wiedmannii]PHB92424.1 hypothetical protein COE96_22820 [Bacillus wiedmannii]
MDVKYRPEPWQNMGDGMNRITKDTLIKLQRANELLKKIDGRIRDLDSDGSIHFNPKDQSQKIGELLDSYSTLQRYCGEAGRLVSEHIDKPFLVEMDKFAQKMRDTSILSFETNNRIGSTTTTVLPDAHAGYGSVPQTIQTKKDKITVEDIFRDSPAFDNVLRAEYKELKKQNPDAKLNYEEYKKVVPSTRGFEYKSIEDEQKKLEMVRDIGIGLGIIITTILCPPLGAAAAVVYGAVQIKSGIDGEDWGTHRKLSQEERVGNIIFGGLDAIPVVGAVGKGVKAFKGTSELADLAKLLKFKEGMPGFNPNLGKNVVQSLRDNKAIMLDRLKLASLKMEKSGNEKMYQLGEKIAKSIDDRTAKSASFEVDGNGLLLSKQGGTDFQSWVNKHHTESNKIIDDKIKGVEASLASKGTGNIGKGASGANEFDDILIDSYKNLRKNKEISGQAHHLNQDAAFRDYIPTNDGLSVKLEGNIFKDIDSPHFNAHKSLEDFWNIYRKNGDLAGLKPNLTDYNNALRDSLINAGLSEAQVNKAVSEAIKQQINAGLLADDFVPRIPGRINLPKPKPKPKP